MKTLVFDLEITGHHLEYLHHFYMGAVERKMDSFVFCLASSFKEQKNLFHWPDADNIEIMYIDSDVLPDWEHDKAWKQGIKYTRILKDVINQVNPHKVLVTSITLFMPYAAFLLPRGVKLCGIIYTIYSYDKSKWTKSRLYIERIRYYLSVKSSIFDSIYLLNDNNSCIDYNTFYNTSKFKYLPDPVPNTKNASLMNIRSKYNIDIKDKFFLHFGGMAERKGTLNILRAIISSSSESLKENVFVFAGRIGSLIRDDFYNLLKDAQKKANIIVVDKFCSYEELYNFCYSCDFILMPYQMSGLSSGLLGYASVFHKTIIGPNDGLIGRLIKEFNLGYCIDSNNISSITDSFNYEPKVITNNYMEYNSLEKFQSILFSD